MTPATTRLARRVSGAAWPLRTRLRPWFALQPVNRGPGETEAASDQFGLRERAVSDQLAQPLSGQVHLPGGLDQRDHLSISHSGRLYRVCPVVYRAQGRRTPNDLVYLPSNLASAEVLRTRRRDVQPGARAPFRSGRVMCIPVWVMFVGSVLAIGALFFGGIAWWAGRTAPRS